MPDAGRNDPCPCGSGRKYKKCCLAADRPPLTLVDDMAVRRSAMARLHQFAARPQFEGDWEIADVLFWSDRLDHLPDEDVAGIIGTEDVEAKFNSFFLFDVDIDDGRRVVDMFLEQKGYTLSAAERGFLERMAASHMALYEITAVMPGEGVKLKDLFTREVVFVTEHSGSTQLATWDLLGARVVADSTGVPRFEGGVYLYPRSGKDTILREFRKYQRRFKKRAPGATVGDFFRRHAAVFNWLWLDLVVLREPPTLVTAEGDEINFTATDFQILDAPALQAALKACADLEADEEGSYTWLEETDEMSRVLGRLLIDGDRLRLETTSRPRGERGRSLLESIAGAAIRHRGTSHTSVESAMAQLRERPRESPQQEVPPEIAADLVKEWQDRHYQRWMDEPVPALDGHTPREAAASKKLRPKLIELLRTFDNHTERGRLAGQPPYETSWLWSALGLKEPER
ncbi:MAG TPA: SEC-C metal-binding domain-containing protein [Vicinamibacterales bacterium]|nr:SEC-C metal-binding domain-containing protein [Vicinamibacterales bacterium]